MSVDMTFRTRLPLSRHSLHLGEGEDAVIIYDQHNKRRNCQRFRCQLSSNGGVI